MKKLFLKITVIALMGVLFTSCSKDDDNGGSSKPKEKTLAELLTEEWNVTEFNVEGSIDFGLASVIYTMKTSDLNLKVNLNASNKTYTYKGSYNALIEAKLGPQVLFSENETILENESGSFEIISETKFKFTSNDDEEIEYEVLSKSNTTLKLRATTNMNDTLDDDDNDFDFDIEDAEFTRTETWTR